MVDARRDAARARAAVALACTALYVAADLALRPTAAPTSHTIPWYPGAGLALVALIVAGAPAAVLLVAARVLLELLPPARPSPLWLSLLDAVGVVGGYAAAAELVRRRVPLRGGGWRLHDALWLTAAIVGGALAAGAASALVGLASGRLDASGLWSDWLAFAAGDAAGAMVVAPLALLVLLPARRRRRGPAVATGSPDEAVAVVSTRQRRVERACEAAAVAATVAVGLVVQGRGGSAIGYLCFLPLAWVAVREGVRGAVVVVAVYGAAFGLAGLWLGIPAARIVDAQLVLLVLGVAGLLLGATRTDAVETEARYWHLLATAGEGVWRIDRTGRTRYVNGRLAGMLGYDAAEMVGRPVFDFVDPAERTDARARLAERLAGAADTYELTLATRQGAPLRALVRASPVRSATTGEVLGSVATLTDLSGWRAAERRRAEAERGRARAQALLEAAFRASPDAMLLFRGEDGLVVEANDVWERIVGVPRAALVGARLADLAPWDDPGDAERLARAVAAGEPVRDVAVALRRAAPGGPPETRHALLSVVPATADGTGPSHHLLLCRDVTEERRAEERRGHGRRLEELGRLAGGVAHDFNNLLTVVSAYAELLRGAAAAGERADPHDVAEIERAAERGRELAQRLLAFGRNRPVEPRPLDLDATLRAAQGMLRPLLGPRVALEYRTADALPPVVADPVQLDQVVLNLAVNAADAMPEGGRLTIAARAARLGAGDAPVATPAGDALPPGEYAVLEVADTGHGMDEATRARVFEPFFTTKGTRGTGLGLAVVAGIVRQARGAVRVRSAPGAGTSVSVWWPAAPPPPAPAARDADGRAAGRPCVMVVEDEDAVRQTVRRLLAQAGFETVEARGGREALERLTTRWRPGEGPEVVVADVVMPGMGGWELAAALADARPDLPVVLVSAFGEAAPHGAPPPNVRPPVLAKPFDRGALAARVREALASSAAAGAPAADR